MHLRQDMDLNHMRSTLSFERKIILILAGHHIAWGDDGGSSEHDPFRPMIVDVNARLLAMQNK
jgi:hypothetical protein